MNPNTIRIIDFWIGRVLCFALTLVCRFGTLVRGQATEKPLRKILFIKLIEQGATIIAVDALRRAAELVGRENVYFCVFSDNAPVLGILDLVPARNVIIIRNADLKSFLFDSIRAIRRMRALEIDATVDLEFFSRASAILAYVSGARRRSGIHRFTSEGPYRGDLMTRRVQYTPYLHTAQMYRLLVEALTLDSQDEPLPKVVPPPINRDLPRFRPSAEMLERVRGLLPSGPVFPTPAPLDTTAASQMGAGVGNSGPLVLLNPNASDLMPLRKWSQERFVEIGKRLLERHADLRVVITGAPSEQAQSEVICEAIGSPRAVSLAGKTTLTELFALYTLADVLMTNDSGPGHFAALTDIHAVVLFGPETPSLYGPMGKNLRVVSAGLACTPCINVYNHRFSPCKNNRCMQAITVDQVFDTIEECLNERKGLGIRD